MTAQPLHEYRPAEPPTFAVDAASVVEVCDTVRAAAERGLPVVVQGDTTVAGAVLLRTTGMRQVLVDPGRRVARVGAGARWADVVAAAEPFGLAPLGADSPAAGVAGHVLGGGLSWLSRRYGFAADSLVRADLVTADGRVVTVNEQADPDLYWAIRGGGGNFGVVTSMEIELYDVPEVYAGSAVFPVDRAVDALAFLSAHGEDLPDELSLSAVLTRTSPVGRGPALVVRGVYAGAARSGRRALQALYAAVGTPTVNGFRSMRYAEASRIGGTPARGVAMYDELPSSLATRMVDAVTHDDTGVRAIEVRHWGGAIARPSHRDPGPVGHRDVPFVAKLDAGPDAVADLAELATGTSFLDFLHDTGRTSTAYTADDYRRLRAVKTAHDPHDVFRPGHHIPPLT